MAADGSISSTEEDRSGSGAPGLASSLRAVEGSLSLQTQGAEMDWGAAVAILASQSSEPLVVLDGRGCIRLFNKVMERTLGWCRFEVEGRAWQSLCSARDARSDGAPTWLDAAFRGALRNHEATLTTKSGSRLAMRLELSIFGRPPAEGLLMTVKSALPLPVFPRDGVFRDDFNYQISLARDEFGRIVHLSGEAGAVEVTERDRPCFSLLYGREMPCEDCPVLTNSKGLTVRLRNPDVNGGSPAQFELTSAERSTDATAKLRVRVLSDEALRDLHETRLRYVTEKRGLTQREQDVLKYLLMGRSLSDIGNLLGISPRTVKYHQSNLMKKIGAESRTDLFRVLF